MDSLLERLLAYDSRWTKVPSVTSGGKPFFWYRRLSDRSEWFLWNRASQQWEFQNELFSDLD